MIQSYLSTATITFVKRQDNDPKYTNKQQHLGSRPPRVTLGSIHTRIQQVICEVTSKMLLLSKKQEMQRDWNVVQWSWTGIQVSRLHEHRCEAVLRHSGYTTKH